MEQVLLVTGGSRGIGSASALPAAANGHAEAVNCVGLQRRGGTAEEVAPAIVRLLSPPASCTTMSMLELSGGR